MTHMFTLTCVLATDHRSSQGELLVNHYEEWVQSKPGDSAGPEGESQSPLGLHMCPLGFHIFAYSCSYLLRGAMSGQTVSTRVIAEN